MNVPNGLPELGVASPFSPADLAGDEELLGRFARDRDEEAFAALVRRHGPMVFGVCRRILRELHDAEDAFQATFLVLARRAGSVGRPELLANWLYGVAYRTARNARARAARRCRHETEAASMSAAGQQAEAAPEELRTLLDRELQRLPEKYRAPLVLCYLEGKTNEEAARQLGWPTGSMSARLARGRELLRERLQARDVLLSAGALAALLGQGAAVVPARLYATTVQAALAVAAGKALASLSPAVLELMENTMKGLVRGRGRYLVALIMALFLAAVSAGAVASVVGSNPPPANPQPVAPSAAGELEQTAGSPSGGGCHCQ